MKKAYAPPRLGPLGRLADLTASISPYYLPQPKG